MRQDTKQGIEHQKMAENGRRRELSIIGLCVLFSGALFLTRRSVHTGAVGSSFIIRRVDDSIQENEHRQSVHTGATLHGQSIPIGTPMVIGEGPASLFVKATDDPLLWGSVVFGSLAFVLGIQAAL